MSGLAARPGADEELVHEELGRAGGPAQCTIEDYRGFVRRYSAWCEMQGLAAFPVDDEVARLFLHAHYPKWRHSYLKTFPAALDHAHRERNLPRPDLRGLHEYLRLLRVDGASAPPQPKVEALRIQEAEQIGSSLAAEPARDPRVARVRAVLVVSAAAGLPLLEVPPSRLQRPDVLWAENLTDSDMVVTNTGVRVRVPGGQVFDVDAGRDPVEYAILADALAHPAAKAFPLAGPAGESRRLALAAAKRVGMETLTTGTPLSSIRPDERRLLIAHVDQNHAKQVRDWTYVLLGLFTTCRHDELSRFMIENVRLVPQGYEVWVDHTKNYRHGRAFQVLHAGVDAVSCTHPLCPACALRVQLDLVRAQGRTSGPVLATRYGGQWRVMTRQNGRHNTRDLWDRAGLPQGARVATRSLRSGGITSASEAGWQCWRIADELSGHRDLNVLEVYVRRRDPFSDEFFLPV